LLMLLFPSRQFAVNSLFQVERVAPNAF